MSEKTYQDRLSERRNVHLINSKYLSILAYGNFSLGLALVKCHKPKKMRVDTWVGVECMVCAKIVISTYRFLMFAFLMELYGQPSSIKPPLLLLWE